MPKKTVCNETIISRKTTFVFLGIFTVLILLSFLAFAFGLTDRDVDGKWLTSYVALLTFYATHKQLSCGWRNHKKLPGEWFVYVSWAVSILIPFMHIFKLGNIKNVPSNLWFYFVAVTAIYLGSRLTQMYSEGMRFFDKMQKQ